MVGARKLALFAAPVGADWCAAVTASVQERMRLTVTITGDNDGSADDLGCGVAIGFRDFDLQGQRKRLLLKDLVDLMRVSIGISVG